MSKPSGGERHGEKRQEERQGGREEERPFGPEVLGLAARERPGRRAQPRHHPAARRSVQRGLRGGRQQHQGHDGAAARLRPAAVRRGPRPALPHPDRHRRQSERRRGRRDRHRGRLDQARGRRHRQDRQAGHRLRHRGPRRHRHHRQGVLRRQGISCRWASELQREECDIAELWVSTKCGESDTTTGLASCPTVGNMYDKLIPRGIYGVFGETSEITGAEHLAKARARSARGRREVDARSGRPTRTT